MSKSSYLFLLLKDNMRLPRPMGHRYRKYRKCVMSGVSRAPFYLPSLIILCLYWSNKTSFSSENYVICWKECFPAGCSHFLVSLLSPLPGVKSKTSHLGVCAGGLILSDF